MKQKLKRLQDNLKELDLLRTEYSLSDIQKDRKLEWALRYGLLECIQLVIDISCHLVSQDGLGYPESYSDCIKLLHQHGYLSNTLKDPLMSMVGLRNILVHEYVDVNVEELFDFLNQLGDVKQFITVVKDR